MSNDPAYHGAQRLRAVLRGLALGGRARDVTRTARPRRLRPPTARELLITGLAAWLLAGPLLSSAAAVSKTASTSHRLGCHAPERTGDVDSRARPRCHASRESAQPAAARRCCCTDPAISTTRCGCHHTTKLVAVTIETTLPAPQFTLAGAAAPTLLRTLHIDDPAGTTAPPPDPPPRA